MSKSYLLLLLCISWNVSYAMEEDNSNVGEQKEYWVDYCVRVMLPNRGECDTLHVHKDVEEALEHLDGCDESLRVPLLRIHDNTKKSAQYLWDQKKSEAEIKTGLLALGAVEGNWTIEEAISKIKQHVGME